MELVYVRACPEKGSVPRYGSGTAVHSNEIVGAVRDPEDPRKLVYSDGLVAIPKTEWKRFRREYLRAVQSGALVVVETPKPEPAPVSPPVVETVSEMTETDPKRSRKRT